MKSFFKFAGAGLFLMSAPLLRADSVLFTLTDSDHVISFSLPSQATPDQSGEDFENIPFFFVNNVAVTVDGTTTNQGVVFSDSGFQHIAFGNAWFVTPEDQVIANNTFAGFFEEEQEIFSGPVGNPTFIPGTAHGFDFEPDREDELAGTLDIETVEQAPEPGSFVLLGSGLLGLAGVVRRRWLFRFEVLDREVDLRY